MSSEIVKREQAQLVHTMLRMSLGELGALLLAHHNRLANDVKEIEYLRNRLEALRADARRLSTEVKWIESVRDHLLMSEKEIAAEKLLTESLPKLLPGPGNAAPPSEEGDGK